MPIVAAERAYTVDVGRMEQVNDTTGVLRNVRRIKPLSKECVCPMHTYIRVYMVELQSSCRISLNRGLLRIP